MKRFAIICILALINLSAVAQYTADGFYRVRNKATQRYIYVCDNTGSINVATTSADMGAIQLWKDTAKYLSDPASIIYMEKQSDGSFDLRAQGTGVHQIIGYYVSVYKLSSGYYQVYAKDGSLVKYLSDNETTSTDDGLLGTDRTGDYRLWSVLPLDNSTNYFGLRPTLQLNGKYYKPFYADFPFSLAGTGMRAFYISKIYSNAAIWTEITGVIPAKTPVYIECNSSHPSGNKLTIGGTRTTISNNKLKGVYFCNHNRVKSKDAHTAYNAQTMRVLGTTADGKLAWIRSNTLSYLPANEAYLPVTTNAADTLPIMTEAEYLVYSKVSSVSLTPTSVTLEAEETATINATVLPTTAVNKDIRWSSSNTSVATVDNGVVTAVSVGTATITATSTDGTNISATCIVTVTPTAVTGIVLTPTSAQAMIGETITLHTEIIPTKATNKAVVWASANNNVATVSANGIVTIMGVGQTTISVTAADGSGIQAECAITGLPIPVSSVSVSASSTSIHIGEQTQCTASVLPASATDKSISWSVSDNRILSIDEEGSVTALAVGNANVTATANNGIVGSVTITVLPTLAESIALDIDTITVTAGDSYQLQYQVLPVTTTNKNVTWRSANNAIATVNNGLVSTKTAGQTIVYVTTADGTELTDSCVVIASPVYIPPVLTESVILSLHEKELRVGKTASISATVLPANAKDKNIQWGLSDSTVISLEDGIITALALGDAYIYVCTTDTNNTVHYSDTCHISVVATPVTKVTITGGGYFQLSVGDSLQLTAKVAPTDATNGAIIWSSNNESVTSVSAEGLVRAIGSGVCYVRAEAADGSGKKDSAMVYVQERAVDSIALNYSTYTMSLGDTLRLEVTYYPDFARKGVFWQSTDPKVAQVSNGKITARSVGETDIIATSSPDGKKDTCHIIVEPIWVEEILLDADTITLYEQGISTLKATVNPSNATTRTLEWQSGDENVATVNGYGRVEARFEGETYITVSATDGSNVYAECVVKVIKRKVEGIFNIEAVDENCRVFDILGRSVSQPTHRGIYIVGRKRIMIF